MEFVFDRPAGFIRECPNDQVTSSLASRSKRLLAAAAAAAEALSSRSPTGGGGGSSGSRIGQSIFGRASGLGLGRKTFWGGGAGGGGAGGGSEGGGGGVGGGGAAGGSGGGGGVWEALDVIVKEAISEAFATADKEFIATSRLPEVGRDGDRTGRCGAEFCSNGGRIGQDTARHD